MLEYNILIFYINIYFDTLIYLKLKDIVTNRIEPNNFSNKNFFLCYNKQNIINNT